MSKKTIQEVEEQNVIELRARMKGLMAPKLFEDENIFQRFLRARNQNLDQAEEMLRKHLKWRDYYKVDTILSDYTPPEVITKYCPFSLLGYDKEGSAVIHIGIGRADTRGLCRSVRKYDTFRSLTHRLEVYLEAMKLHGEKTGKHSHQWVFIFDYEKLQLANVMYKPAIELLVHLIQLQDSNYPERLKAAYLVNGYAFFELYWAIVKPFLPSTVHRKVKIFGKDGYQELLLKNIDADVLPKFLGGNRTDPDGNPMCAQSVNLGGTVPECYLLINDPRRHKFRCLVVPRSGKEEVEMQVLHPGTTIEWEFEVTCKDVEFSVVHKESEEEVVGKQRVKEGHLVKGDYKCEEPGIFCLVFDNTYSWILKKQINYIFSIVET